MKKNLVIKDIKKLLKIPSKIIKNNILIIKMLKRSKIC